MFVHGFIIFDQQTHIRFLYCTEATDLHETIVEYVQCQWSTVETLELDILNQKKEETISQTCQNVKPFREIHEKPTQIHFVLLKTLTRRFVTCGS